MRTYPRLLDMPVTYYHDGRFSVGDRNAYVEHPRNLKKLWEFGTLTLKGVSSTGGATLVATNLEMQRNLDNLVIDYFLDENRECFNQFVAVAAAKKYERMRELLALLLREEEVDMHSERYMQFILFGCFKALNLLPEMEYPADKRKRNDIILKTFKDVEYVFELKYDSTLEAAIAQLKANEYCKPSCIDAEKTANQ